MGFVSIYMGLYGGGGSAASPTGTLTLKSDLDGSHVTLNVG